MKVFAPGLLLVVVVASIRDPAHWSLGMAAIAVLALLVVNFVSEYALRRAGAIGRK